MSTLWFTTDYDSIVLVKISDPILYPLIYEIIAKTMLYDPYGVMNPNALYMKDSIYQKKYFKSF